MVTAPDVEYANESGLGEFWHHIPQWGVTCVPAGRYLACSIQVFLSTVTARKSELDLAPSNNHHQPSLFYVVSILRCNFTLSHIYLVLTA